MKNNPEYVVYLLGSMSLCGFLSHNYITTPIYEHTPSRVITTATGTINVLEQLHLRTPQGFGSKEILYKAPWDRCKPPLVDENLQSWCETVGSAELIARFRFIGKDNGPYLFYSDGQEESQYDGKADYFTYNGEMIDRSECVSEDCLEYMLEVDEMLQSSRKEVEQKLSSPEPPLLHRISSYLREKIKAL